MNKFKFLLTLFLIGLVSIFSGCSKAVMDDFQAMIKADFGGYTKEEPFKIYVLPFRPYSEKEGDSQVAKVSWEFITDSIKSSALFFDERMRVKVLESKEYVNKLRNPYWNDIAKEDERVLNILKSTAKEYNVNAILYGLYDGDDSEIKLVVNLYSEKDDIVLKEKIQLSAHFMLMKSLRNSLKEGKKLSTSQEELQKVIREKLKVAGVHLLRKYVEGRNS